MSSDSVFLRVCIVDDEALALKRLARLLTEIGGVEIAGSFTDPETAIAFLTRERIDALFLDVQMPGLDGFQLLARLPQPPRVVFTTAHDQYAAKAFEVDSIDYLLKPIEPARLEKTLARLEASRDSDSLAFDEAVKRVARWVARQRDEYPERIPSRIGERIQMIDLEDITHFFSRDKLTYAATKNKTYVIDHPISDLERRLDPRKWLRIHRSTLLNIAHIEEVRSWFGSGMRIRLNDEKHTELTVARDRVKLLRERLGF